MDPDANLTEQRELAARLVVLDDVEDYNLVDVGSLLIDAARLGELVLALDGWLVKVGYLPKRWAFGDAHGTRTD